MFPCIHISHKPIQKINWFIGLYQLTFVNNATKKDDNNAETQDTTSLYEYLCIKTGLVVEFFSSCFKGP